MSYHAQKFATFYYIFKQLNATVTINNASTGINFDVFLKSMAMWIVCLFVMEVCLLQELTLNSIRHSCDVLATIFV